MTLSKIQLLTSKMSSVSLLITCAISISGCGSSWLSSRDTNPIIQDYTVHIPFMKSSTNVFATKAERRLVIIAERPDGLKTCAEPPPDVSEAFASAVAAGLTGAVTVTEGAGPKATGELAAQYGRGVATQVAPLLYRTQGLQIYRDSIYKLCVDKLNGWMEDPKEYVEESSSRFAAAIELIKLEITSMLEAQKSFYEKVKAGDARVNVNDMVKIIEATKKDPATTPADGNATPEK